MFEKPVTKLEYQDILDLVNVRRVGEGQHIDYKLCIGSSDRDKKSVAEDVAAFANANGGYLIYGIRDDKQIVGIDENLDGKPVIEWINQVLSSNIDPIAFYHDPHPIRIPGSNKIILVIHIPESMKKPHHCTRDSRYYVRVNDKKMHAKHYQIRDMFEFSKNRMNDFKEFLLSRNLLSENDDNFCENTNTRRLANDIAYLITNWGLTGNIQSKEKAPKVVFSLIPTNIQTKKVQFPISDLKVWLEKNMRGYQPNHGFSLMRTHYCDTKFDGLVYRIPATGNPQFFQSYLEICENGYIEAGFSNSVCWLQSSKPHGTHPQYSLMLTPIIGYALTFLGFAKRYFEYINYDDEIMYQLSFANVLNYKLSVFNDQFNMINYTSNDEMKNRHTSSFKMSEIVRPSALTYENILQIVMPHSERICNAFGLDRDYCFYDDGSISSSYLKEIHSWQDHRKEFKSKY